MSSKKPRQPKPEKEIEADEYIPEYEAGPYRVTRAGELYILRPEKNGEGIAIAHERIANHAPILQEIIKTDDGTNKTERYMFRAFRNGQFSEAIPVDFKTMVGNQPGLPIGGCRIEIGRGHKEMYSDYMQRQCEDKPPLVVYQHTGWTQIDGKRAFLNGGNSVTEAGLTDKYTVELDPGMDGYCFYPVTESDGECLDVLLNDVPKAMPESVYVPMLAYCFLTPLNEILRSVGHEPSFILYLIGKTGTFKTSLSLLFLCFFGRFSHRGPIPASFSDTKNSLERKVAVLEAIPLLLDDRKPAVSKIDNENYTTLERAAIAFIGDRKGRDRMNADGSARNSYKSKSNLIVTAEESYQHLSSSDIARTIATEEIKPGTIDFDNLRSLQQKRQCFNKAMQLYIEYVIKNWDGITQAAEDNLDELVDEFTDIVHGRLAETGAILSFGYAIYLKFMQEYQRIDEDRSRGLFERAKAVFGNMIKAQNRTVEAEAPTTLFIEALQDLLTADKIQLVRIRSENNKLVSNTFQPRKGAKVGYIDEEGRVYLIPGAAYSAVTDFCARNNKPLNCNTSNLWQAFKREGRIITGNTENSSHRNQKRKRIDDKQPWLIWFTLEASKELTGEDQAAE